jgi:hypothetical protein
MPVAIDSLVVALTLYYSIVVPLLSTIYCNRFPLLTLLVDLSCFRSRVGPGTQPTRLDLAKG